MPLAFEVCVGRDPKTRKKVWKSINKIGAKCPNPKCNAKFVWDWCQDTYHIWPSMKEAIVAEEIKISKMKNWEPRHMTNWYCNKCGTWLGKEIYRKIDKYTSEITVENNNKWNDIEWDDWGYAFPWQ